VLASGVSESAKARMSWSVAILACDSELLRWFAIVGSKVAWGSCLLKIPVF